MMRLGSLREFSRGVSIGSQARELMTEMRILEIDTWETDLPGSHYHARLAPARQELENLSVIGYLGIMCGQLRRPREWFRNAEYLFDNCDTI